MADVAFAGEILINGERYDLATGTKVELQSLSTIEGEQALRRVVLVDATRGIGIQSLREGQDAALNGRIWFSLADTITYGQLTLPYLATSASKPSGVADNTPCYLLFEWQGLVYAVWGDSLYLWSGPTGTTWSSAIATFTAQPQDTAVHTDSAGVRRVFIFCNTAFVHITESGTVTVLVSTAAHHGVSYNGFLWAIDELTGAFKRDADGTTAWGSWTARQALPLNSGERVLKLVLYRTSGGEAAIYAKTTNGLWLYDDTNNKWSPTELQVPTPSNISHAAAVWRGVPTGENSQASGVYVPMGQDVYGYVAGSAGEQAAIIDLTPGAPDGLPDGYAGYVADMFPAHNAMFALVTAADWRLSAANNEGDANNGFVSEGELIDADAFYIAQGRSTLLAWNGRGWHVLWRSAAATDWVANKLLVAAAYGKYRVYFVVDNIMYWMDIPQGTINASQDTTLPRAASGEIVFPHHFGSGPGSMDVLKRILSRTAGASSTETVAIAYDTNKSGSYTTAVTRNTNGLVTTTLDPDADSNGEGVLFDFLQFRASFARGGTTTSRPLLEYLAFDYVPGALKKLTWTATLDLRGFKGQRSADGQRDELVTLADPAVLVPVIWQNQGSSTDEVHMCKLVSIQGSADGQIESGVYKVTFLEV